MANKTEQGHDAPAGDAPAAGSTPSNGNGAPAGAPGLKVHWHSGTKALNDSLEEWRVKWTKVSAWARGKPD